MAIAKLSGAEIFYEIDGSGEPLVLVPGFASGAWSWSWQAEDLSRNFQVITFDPRGVANSTVKDDSPISIESIAGDISDLLDEMEIEAAHILGISFGGFVAQEFALRYPEKLRKLVLASTSFGGPHHVAPSMEVLAAFASTDGLNSAERIRQYLSMAFSPDYASRSAETVDRFCTLREENSVPEQVYLQQLRSATGFDRENEVSSITAEALIITGANDTVVPMQNAVNLAAKIPISRLEVIADIGHMAFVERPSEFNRIVREFLLA